MGCLEDGHEIRVRNEWTDEFMDFEPGAIHAKPSLFKKYDFFSWLAMTISIQKPKGFFQETNIRLTRKLAPCGEKRKPVPATWPCISMAKSSLFT